MPTHLTTIRILQADPRGEARAQSAATRRLGTWAWRAWAIVTVTPCLAVLGAIAYVVVSHHTDSPAGYGG